MQSHIYFENLEEKSGGEVSPESTKSSEKKIEELESVPLNDSVIYEEVIESHQDDKKVTGEKDDLVNMSMVEYDRASKVMAELENLLFPGSSELI